MKAGQTDDSNPGERPFNLKSILLSHGDTLGRSGKPMTRHILHEAADRIEALESELLRISAVVGEVDYELIQSLLADDLK